MRITCTTGVILIGRYVLRDITHLIYVNVHMGIAAPMAQWLHHMLIGSGIPGRKEGNVLFNDALNTFYLRLYGVRHMVKDHSDSMKGNPLPPHRLLFPISSKGSFICTIPQTG